MQPALLPLFPLPVVLFPRTQLPLHIFEDRYKEMIGEAIRDKTEFGVVLSAEKDIADVGCTGIIEEVTERYPDGRLDIVVVGMRRFEILDLDSEKSYLRGAVNFFNDEETEAASPEVAKQALKGYTELRASSRTLETAEPKWQDPQLSFQLAQAIPDVAFRQRLLVSRSEAERIQLLAEFIPQHIKLQKYIEHIKSVAPTNGHGPHSVVE